MYKYIFSILITRNNFGKNHFFTLKKSKREDRETLSKCSQSPKIPLSNPNLILIFSGKKCQLINTDLFGSDIRGIKDIPSWYECGHLCLKNPDCGSFTWMNKTRECYLKTGVPSQSVNMETVSGVAACFNSIAQGMSVLNTFYQLIFLGKYHISC